MSITAARCLTLSLSMHEMLTAVKLLSKRVQELESSSDDLLARLQLQESHGIPESPPNNLEYNLTMSTVSSARHR